MKRSIRTFLLINLLVSITLITLLVVIGNFYLDQKEFRNRIDNQLTYVSLTLQAIINENPGTLIKLQRDINEIPKLIQITTPSSEHIEYKVWNDHNKLLLHSPGILPTSTCLKKIGFNNCIIDHVPWRVYVSHDPVKQDTIIIAERYSFHDRLATQAARDLIIIMLISYPILGLLIWIIIGKGLISIRRVTTEVRQRAASNLQTVDTRGLPTEIKPLVNELNKLFERLQAAFQREKHFATNAAHELKTPLAALRTQTQVALNTTDDKERTAALNKILECVDRSTHTVQQLLILSRMVPEAILEQNKPVSLNKKSAQVTADLVPMARKKNIEIELIAPSKPQTIIGNATAINILLRNLIDNAIRYSPKGGSVQIVIEPDNKFIVLKVIDSGPGIPKELRKRVFERFYRIIGTEPSGSGLGLSIVQQIAQIHKAKIRLVTPKSGKGLEVRVIFRAA
jgi:two-component system sensor histidine kinase QseC